MPDTFEGLDGKLVLLDSGDVELHFGGWLVPRRKKKASPVCIPRSAIQKAELVVQKGWIKHSYLRLHLTAAAPTADFDPATDLHTLCINDEDAARFDIVARVLNGTIERTDLRYLSATECSGEGYVQVRRSAFRELSLEPYASQLLSADYLRSQLASTKTSSDDPGNEVQSYTGDEEHVDALRPLVAGLDGESPHDAATTEAQRERVTGDDQGPAETSQASKAEVLKHIERLEELRAAGVLTEEEFQAKKQDLLDRL